MASSAVDICNLANSFLKIDDPVTDIINPNDATEEEYARWYDVVRKDALRSSSWNFARKRAVLSKSVPQPEFGDAVSFVLPGDYIRLISIGDNAFLNQQPLSGQAYSIEQQNILVSTLRAAQDNSESLNIIYINDFKNVPLMTTEFITYLALLLAHRLAYKFTQSNTTVQRIDTLMKEQERRIQQRNGQENPVKITQKSPNLSARRNPTSSSNRNANLVIF